MGSCGQVDGFEKGSNDPAVDATGFWETGEEKAPGKSESTFQCLKGL